MSTCGTTCDVNCPVPSSGGCKLPNIDKIDLKWEDPEIKIVTEIYITGDGQFDRYMRAGYEQLKRHYEDGRIKGADFTAAHIQMTELMMTQANTYVLQKYKIDAEVQLMELEFKMKLEKDKLERQLLAAQVNEMKQKCELTAAQASLTTTQCKELVLNGQSKRTLEAAQARVQAKMEALYEAQAEGFDDKAKNDLMKTLSNMWSVYASEYNEAEGFPNSVLRTNMDNTINDVKDAVGLDHKAPVG